MFHSGAHPANFHSFNRDGGLPLSVHSGTGGEGAGTRGAQRRASECPSGDDRVGGKETLCKEANVQAIWKVRAIYRGHVACQTAGALRAETARQNVA